MPKYFGYQIRGYADKKIRGYWPKMFKPTYVSTVQKYRMAHATKTFYLTPKCKTYLLNLI